MKEFLYIMSTKSQNNNPMTQGSTGMLPAETWAKMSKAEKRTHIRLMRQKMGYEPSGIPRRRAPKVIKIVKKQREKHVGFLKSKSKTWKGKTNAYLLCLIDPRSSEGCRVPDPYCRTSTATYQSKTVLNIIGASGTSVGAGNAGRWSVVLNPIIPDAINSTPPSFNGATCPYQICVAGGTDPGVTAVWNNYFQATAATNFDKYQNDPMQQSLVVTNGNGAVQTARPVSASMLASYNGNLTEGGGNISAALVHGNSWQMDLTNSSGSGLNLKNWEDLAEYPGAYDGPLREGAYCYWVPDSENDYLLRPIDTNGGESMSAHEYPLLVISGQNSAITTTQIRVDIYINFEYTTNDRTRPSMHGPKNAGLRHQAMAKLATEPTSMPNDAHIDWIKGLIGAAGGFLLGGPMGAVVGGMAGLGISGVNTAIRGAYK